MKEETMGKMTGALLDTDAAVISEKELDHIRKMYSRSMATVFNECVIVNLTKDYYVNYQKGSLFEKHPKWKSFSYVQEHYGRLKIHPEDMPLFSSCFSRESMLEYFEEGKRQIVRRMRRMMEDGKYHMVEFAATRIEELGEDCWTVLVFRDINEEHLQELNRNVEMENLATAARIAYEMLIAVNLTKNTYYMMEYDRYSTKNASLSGCFDDLIAAEAETVAPEYREEFVSKFSRKALLDTFSGGQNQVYMEVKQLGDDGKYHWNSNHVVQVQSPYTSDVIEITMAKNIDEERSRQEKNLEKERQSKALLMEALQKAEAASSAKSDFMSRMSHDIRTPMNAIIGLSSLAQIHIDKPDKIKHYLEQIETAGTHLLGLINEILDVSKIESGKIKVEGVEFELDDLIQEVSSIVRPAYKSQNQNLNIEMMPGINRCLQGDQQKLRQILVNLLDNASKYSEKGKQVDFIILENGQDDAVMGTYQFIVKDYGIGMTKEYLEHIFEPFSRAEESSADIFGTGLGLTIVRNLVSMMGGTIDIESEYGQGSRFTVTLCLKKVKKKYKKEEKELILPAKVDSAKRVLLVEDNEINQQIAIEMLNLLGVEVDLAANGRQAVELIEEKPVFYYRMVFMDIQMPVMNGYDATAKIRANPKGALEHLPIIAMTADAFSEDIKKSRMAGMNEHLAKPISMEKLQKILEFFLEA